MQKTKKSIAKRFKVTGTGKVVRRKPGKRHMLRNKNKKQLRRMGQSQLLDCKKMARSIKQAMSPGL
jgi:large subunit ribosomal protein L35|tara:strand:+ start:189 stop:386 length:198 start_codon:yes stop_codon:yes gene_type:complete